MPDMLRFDADSHAYFLDGERLPSVTQVLQRAGLIDTTWFTEYARNRGSQIHAAIALYNDHDLDESRLDPVIQPYLEAYRLFLSETRFRVYRHETRVYSRQYRYAGTFDLYGRLARSRVLVDFKSGAVSDWVGLQLAAYKQAAIECGLRPQRRFYLQLLPSGQYRLREEKNPLDWERFLQALERRA